MEIFMVTFNNFKDYGCYYQANNIICYYKEKYWHDITNHFNTRIVSLDKVIEYLESIPLHSEEDGEPTSLWEEVGKCYIPIHLENDKKSAVSDFDTI